MINKKVKLFSAISAIALSLVIFAGVIISDMEKGNSFVNIFDEKTPLSSGAILVEQTDADINIIPDKYNTGCKGELTKITEACDIDGIHYKISGGYIVLDFFYSNKNVSGEVVINNLDFSEYDFSINSEGKVTDRTIHVIFNNCKFGSMKTGLQGLDNMSYTYNNCTMLNFNGSNSTFNNCQFGHFYKDCIVPYQNVYANYCYFADLASTDPASAGKHSDGSQVYAHKDVPAKNIIYTRCRFEIPAVQTTGDTAAVNACVAVALEYNDATNIHIRDCIANGGGYTFYGSKKRDWINMTDISFDNIKVGSARLFGAFYPAIDSGVSINNVEDIDSLYVSSVWKDEEGIHIITSNDTGVARKLKVIADDKEYFFDIKVCLGGKELRYDNFDLPFEAFPFDVDFVIPGDARYVVCYDVTEEEKQVRFVNWSDEPVYIQGPALEYGFEYVGPESIIGVPTGNMNRTLTGFCGDDVTYMYKSNGTLLISGFGDMYDFENESAVPWSSKMSSISTVLISEGVTSIGNHAFENASKFSVIEFPTSIQRIGDNAFAGCTNLCTVNYLGGNELWNLVSVGENNDLLVKRINSDEEIIEDKVEIENMSGACGDNIVFVLDENGSLTISGTGSMKNFDSSKPAPWSTVMDSITSVTVEEGITSIGSQAFRHAKQLCEVKLPESIQYLGNSCFSGCTSLKSITLGVNISDIGAYAFSGSGLTEVHYQGDINQWNNISVGKSNDVLSNCLIFDVVEEEVHYEAAASSELLSGSCGDSITYILNADGSLVISGSGEMKNFDSSKPAPWSSMMDSITSVVVEEGITSVGNQAFRHASNISTVSLPSTIYSIGSNAFSGCSSLRTIVLSAGITNIGAYAFSGVGLESATYLGDESGWANVEIGKNNDSLVSLIQFQ